MWNGKALVAAAGIIAFGLIASSVLDLISNRYAVSASANQNIAYRIDTVTGAISICAIQEPRLLNRQVQRREPIDGYCSEPFEEGDISTVFDRTLDSLGM